MKIQEIITEDFHLDEGLGDWIEKKIDDLLGNRTMSGYNSMKVQQARAQAPANIPDDIAKKLVAEFMAKKENEAALAKAAYAQKTTVEKIKPYLDYFVGNFVDRWRRISRADKQRMLKDLALGVFRLIMFILEALAKSKR
jgi:hypothetical protein